MAGTLGLLTSLSNRLQAVTRHDLVLAVIPSAFVVAILVGNLLSVTARTALIAASIVGTLAVVDALFVNPPVDGDSS